MRFGFHRRVRKLELLKNVCRLCLSRFATLLFVRERSENVDLLISPHNVVAESQKVLLLRRTSCEFCDVALLFPNWNLFHEMGDEPRLIFEVSLVVMNANRSDSIENFVDDVREIDKGIQVESLDRWHLHQSLLKVPVKFLASSVSVSQDDESSFKKPDLVGN